MTTPAVRAEGLVKSFEDIRAVDGVDLSVEPGSVVGVLGPNGAGKTTVLRMLATLLRIDAGRAEVFGVDVTREPHRARQLIGVTGQYASVDEKLTGRENIELFARLQGQSRSRARSTAADLLDRFGLTEARDRNLESFSGGMRRRLDLAASLIARPPLIFLDEPTTGLDPRTRGQMWATIRELVAQGSTILLTTQYLDEADQLADRIVVIDHGRVVAEGTPAELKSSVGDATLTVGIADRSRILRAVEIAQHALARPANASPEARRVSVPLETASDATDVLLALRQNGIDITDITVDRPTLDEVFLALTGHHVPADSAEQSGAGPDQPNARLQETHR